MITVDALKLHLNIPDAMTAHDELLAQLERSAVAFVQDHTGIYLGDDEEEREVLLTGMGRNGMWLPDVPVDGEVEMYEWSGSAWTLLDEYAADGWTMNGREIVRGEGYYWTRGYRYKAVYTRIGEPTEDIRQRVIDLVALWYSHRTPSAERAEGEQAVRDSLPRAPVIA